jgi:heme a synthase
MCALGAQGVIGYVQYFNHLPAGLVWVHVSWAVVLWIFVLRLYLSTRERMPADGTAGTDGTAATAQVSAAETSPARSASAR